MNYEEFVAHYDKAMADAKRKYGAKASTKPPIVDPGMDAAVEAFILSPDYVTAGAQEAADAAVEALTADGVMP